MMPILAKGDYVESKTKVNARHGRLRSQWVKSLKRNNTVIYGKDSISYFTLRLEKISNKDSLVFLGNKIQVFGRFVLRGLDSLSGVRVRRIRETKEGCFKEV